MTKKISKPYSNGRGLATLTPAQRSAIARLGGLARYNENPEAMSLMGQIGGTKTSHDRIYMSQIGRLGGLAANKRKTTND